MRKKMFGAGVLVMLFSILSVGLWRYSLTFGCQWSIDHLINDKDPLALVDGFISEMKNDTAFPKKMHLVEKKSFWPANTKYDIYWNGLTLNSNNKVLAKNTWLEVAVWNGYGITHLEIHGLDTNQLLGSADNTQNPNISANGVTAQIGQNKKILWGEKEWIAAFFPSLKTLQKEKRLRLTVTDIFGNISEAIVETSSITH